MNRPFKVIWMYWLENIVIEETAELFDPEYLVAA